MHIRDVFLLNVIFLAAMANAQVFKCEVDGKTVYNQTPCGAGGQEMRLKTQPAASPDAGLRESEIRMLEGIQAREREQEQRRQEELKADPKQRLNEVQAEAAADARGRECAKKSSKLIELEQRRDDSRSVSGIRELGEQIELLREAMEKLGCN